MGPELGLSRVYHFRRDITLDNITLDRFYYMSVLENLKAAGSHKLGITY
jgi:hypothetical protein